MKKGTFALLIWLTIAGIYTALTYPYEKKKPEPEPNRIIKQVTDERGLTSVVFVQDGKTWALDYLDSTQLETLKISLK